MRSGISKSLAITHNASEPTKAKAIPTSPEIHKCEAGFSSFPATVGFIRILLSSSFLHTLQLLV
jgi:hypothetical protein